MSLRASIDRVSCVGCGSCQLNCQEVIELNSEDYKSQIYKGFRYQENLGEGVVPHELGNPVKVAVDFCLSSSIQIRVLRIGYI